MTTENKNNEPKKLSLADLVAKKSEKLAERTRTETVYIPSLGGEIEVSNPGRKAIYTAIDKITNTTEDAMYSNAMMVYQSVKLFQDTELHKAYEVVDPIDIVFALLTHGEIKIISQLIMKLSGFDEPGQVEQDVKN